jgi:hypothetical protein
MAEAILVESPLVELANKGAMYCELTRDPRSSSNSVSEPSAINPTCTV